MAVFVALERPAFCQVGTTRRRAVACNRLQPAGLDGLQKLARGRDLLAEVVERPAQLSLFLRRLPGEIRLAKDGLRIMPTE
ncbi:hypothetical protein [Piscinibacter sp. HJYY11]|uniref:hypothetical protein n=1 Tax=Piscinibacter sp. HJYY11 TaxID=2801333 RepID=UPI00191F4545|nr:hypothetical protein [Piscinibacter sp. HJYY11]MBL0726512.1 hypothetical protein [Piscinibacter sp. HJYY11]